METIENLEEKRAVLELTAKRLDNQRKRLDIAESKRDLLLTQKKIIMEQVNHLRDLLTDEVINEEKTLFGSEPIYKPLLTAEETEKIKRKIWKLLDEF
jgi:hypothetical protein